LREYEILRNGKLILSCAEAVEDRSSLWKQKEKVEEIFPIVWGGHSCPPPLNLNLGIS